MGKVALHKKNTPRPDIKGKIKLVAKDLIGLSAVNSSSEFYQT
jgi:predicted RNA-binding protein with PUA-like domain